jgi:glucokinase
MKVLAGDIGGTSARLALFDVDAGDATLLHKQRFASKDFPGLSPIITTFLADVAELPDAACIGMACPVVNGVCRMTNLSWTINARSLASEIGIPRTGLINDFYALGHALPHLTSSDIVVLQTGEPDARGVKALIGAGTGLGQAFVTWSSDAYHVHASEGGHASFSATNDRESRLLASLADRYGHVSSERVVSGPGLVSVYQFLAVDGDAEEQNDVRAEMERSDPAAVISRHALARTDPLSEQALDLFASAYGAQAGDLALTVMATGGVYVAGGIAPRIVPKLRDGTFMNAFRDKGRLSDVLSRIPVIVIVNSDVGLIGAAAAAMRLWPDRRP